MKTVLIQGSSRSYGDTRKYVDVLLAKVDMDFVDLTKFNIGQYDYAYKNKDDDFLKLIKRLILDYDHWLFATPLYWYNMSGYTKTFIDRISDILRTDKDLGRQMRGMYMSVLAESIEDDLPDYFFEPFKLSADYLGMQYLADLHVWGQPDNISKAMLERIDKFAYQIHKQ